MTRPGIKRRSPGPLANTLTAIMYMYKQDLVLKDSQGLICHNTQSNQSKPNITRLL